MEKPKTLEEFVNSLSESQKQYIIAHKDEIAEVLGGNRCDCKG